MAHPVSFLQTASQPPAGNSVIDNKALFQTQLDHSVASLLPEHSIPETPKCNQSKNLILNTIEQTLPFYVSQWLMRSPEPVLNQAVSKTGRTIYQRPSQSYSAKSDTSTTSMIRSSTTTGSFSGLPDGDGDGDPPRRTNLYSKPLSADAPPLIGIPEYICDHCDFTGSHKTVTNHAETCDHRENHLRIVDLENPERVAEQALQILIDSVNEFEPTDDHPYFVLVLPTGNTPIRLYELLVEAVQSGRVSLNNVILMNMDEYAGISPDDQHSYYQYITSHLVRHNLSFRDVFLFSGRPAIGNPTAEEMNAHLALEVSLRERLFETYGDPDLVIAGVGSNGHIAFNEPGSPPTDTTRVVTLSESTREANTQIFQGSIPDRAITIGMGNILLAKRVLILAQGETKQDAVFSAAHGRWTTDSPITLLQSHKDAILLTDQVAFKKVKDHRNQQSPESQ